MLLWDGTGWHRGSKVQDDGQIKTLYFPPYSVKENPQEPVWKAGRSALTHNKFIPDVAKSADELISHVNQSYFNYELCGFTPQSRNRSICMPYELCLVRFGGLSICKGETVNGCKLIFVII